MYFSGYQLIQNPYMADKVQARTHKKKRINKKYLKRYGMREMPWNKFCIVDDKIYAHPVLIQRLINEVEVKEWNYGNL